MRHGVVALYRMLFASIALIPISLPKFKLNSKKSLYFALAAGFCLACHFALWISSLSYTTIAASASLVSTIPLWTLLIAWLFLSIRPSFYGFLGVMLAVLGSAIVAFGDLKGGSQPLLGNMLALLGAMTGALYFLLGRSAQRLGLNFPSYIMITYLMAALSLLPLPAIFNYSYVKYSLETFIWMLLLALIPQLIGHSSFNFLMKELNPSFVSTLILMEVVGSSLLALLIFKETPSSFTLLGMFTLLTGISITIWQNAALKISS
ncbi:MAG: DMT family transporter [Deinococcales bacterium]